MSENLVQLTVPTPDAKATQAAAQFLSLASDLKVVTAEDYTGASDTLKSIKGRWTDIDNERKKLKEPIDKAAKAVQDFFRAPLETLSRAEYLVKGKLASYLDAQEKLRRAEQAKLDAAAKAERERLEARAAKAEASGKAEKAQALAEQASAVVAPIVTRPAPAATGVGRRTIWRYRVIDEKAVPREYLALDDAKIAGVVRALKGDTQIAGIEVYEETSISAGRI